MEYLSEVIVAFVTAFLTGGTTWFWSRHTNRAGAIKSLQETINQLAADNKKTMDELIEQRKQNIDILEELHTIKAENSTLRGEIAQLKSLLKSKA